MRSGGGVPRVAFVPSWYPSARYPLAGTFFREQAHMVGAAGVIALSPFDPRVVRPGARWFDEDGLTVVRGALPTLPVAGWPLEWGIIRALTARAARLWEAAAAPPQLLHVHSAYPGLLVGQLLAERWGGCRWC